MSGTTLGGATLSPSPTTNRLPSSLATCATNGAVTGLFDLDQRVFRSPSPLRSGEKGYKQ